MGALASGLEGVVVAETRLSDVDGEAGRLIVAGESIEKLAGTVSFETVFGRLMDEAAPDFGPYRARAWELVPKLHDVFLMRNGMDALRASVGRLDSEDPLFVTAATAVFAAAWSRTSRALEPIAPDASLGHAADYVRMLGSPASDPGGEDKARAVDAYLVTVSDHGMNASTFTARVIASTGSDLVSSVTGAIGALKGPLHGGAPGPVLDMLDAIGAPENADAWIRAELDAGRRIMGMGHRIYRVRDPRAAVLEREMQKLERAGIASDRLALARATERAAEHILAERHPDRPLRANVEFYTAVLLEAAGIPRPAFSPTFAVSRVAGWCAHVSEQRKTGRLIRPASRYVGP
jgi:citrate synthase